MAPHVEAFQASRLEHEIQYRTNGRLHKTPVDLKQCALKELIQYETVLGGPQSDPKTKVLCQPVLRLFRQYVSPSDQMNPRRGLTDCDGIDAPMA